MPARLDHDAEKATDQAIAEQFPQPASKRKSFSFYLAFMSLLIVVLIVSLDATILVVAIPVSRHRPTAAGK